MNDTGVLVLQGLAAGACGGRVRRGGAEREVTPGLTGKVFNTGKTTLYLPEKKLNKNLVGKWKTEKNWEKLIKA